MQYNNHSVVNLFWSGGWDSTYRILQLLILQNKMVQPFYLIDPNRLSTGIEIQSMNLIKKELINRYPETKKLLLPTIYKDLYDVQRQPDLPDMYNRISLHQHLGIQYLWLAEFCSENSIDTMELSIEKDGGAYKVLKSYIVRSGSANNINYKINEKFRDLDEYGLFHFFRFPLFHLTKLEMQDIATKQGYQELMELTWFCHSPRGNARPCGVCTPCCLVIQEGLGRRIPLLGRMRYILRVKPRIQELRKKHPSFFKFLSTMKQLLKPN